MTQTGCGRGQENVVQDFAFLGGRNSISIIRLLISIFSMYVAPQFQTVEQRLIFQIMLNSGYVRSLAVALYQCL